MQADNRFNWPFSPRGIVGWPWAVVCPGLARIRTCAPHASGSSGHGVAAQREPADAFGAIFPVSSLSGRMFISLTSCPEMVPEPEFFADCIRASIAEMGPAAAARMTPRRKAHEGTHPKAARRQRGMARVARDQQIVLGTRQPLFPLAAAGVQAQVPQPCKRCRRRDKDSMKAPRIVAATRPSMASCTPACDEKMRGLA
jgi:hypothetical protein